MTSSCDDDSGVSLFEIKLLEKLSENHQGVDTEAMLDIKRLTTD